jgi:hypothetical protein
MAATKFKVILVIVPNVRTPQLSVAVGIVQVIVFWQLLLGRLKVWFDGIP